MATSSNYTQLSYIEEVTEGVTPSGQSFQLLPTTGGSPVSNITTAVSEVIRADRQTDDLVVVDSSVGGDINYELSYTAYKPFLEALMQSTPTTLSTNVTGISVSDADTIGAASIESNVAVGDVIKLTSTTNPEIDNGYIVTALGTDTIDIKPSIPSTALSATDLVLDVTSEVSNGAEDPTSFTFRKKATEGVNDYYWYYQGCKISTMNFNFATGSILNGSFSVLGLTEETSDSGVLYTETADTDVAAYTILNSVNNVGAIVIDGVTVGECSFSSMDLTIDNQINEAKSIGKLGACATASFSLQVTGNVEVYFKNLDMYNKFLNAESFGVTIALADGDTQVIGIRMPNCKFESLDSPIDGKDTFLMQSGSFRALRDATDNYMIRFTFVD